jgi:hypothetical protein
MSKRCVLLINTYGTRGKEVGSREKKISKAFKKLAAAIKSIEPLAATNYF